MSRPMAAGLALIVVLGVGACSSGEKGELEWVAGLAPGDCVDPEGKPGVTVNRMRVVPCREGHAMEVYARLPYPPVATPSADVTPSASPTSSAGPTSSASPTSSAVPKSSAIPTSLAVPKASALGSPLLKGALGTPSPSAAVVSSSEYPGHDILRTFAREACADHFRDYLGSNPRESWYFLTYLFPSVASWTAASAQRPKLGPLARLVTSSTRSDRSVICFVRTTGPALTASVRGQNQRIENS
ncbi:MAG TPA: hypothetical protein VLL08_20850 [Kineosporiaceae bacterium]|nr:hypothetical protein [Kineosporiaceae bacterium]